MLQQRLEEEELCLSQGSCSQGSRGWLSTGSNWRLWGSVCAVTAHHSPQSALLGEADGNQTQDGPQIESLPGAL